MFAIEQQEVDGRWFVRARAEDRLEAQDKAARYTSMKNARPTRIVETDENGNPIA